MIADSTNNKKQPMKKRETNLELFRIITMIMIVAHHYVVNSGLLEDMGPIVSNIFSLKSIFLLLFGAWGKIGINCFVLITGYFMCKSSITLNKFLKLILEVMFYRIAINAIFWISGYAEFTIKALVKAILPISSVATGFTDAYLIFFLCIPFINILIKNMTRKQHLYLLLLTTFMYVFMGTFKFVFDVTMNYVSWFFVLYIIASYIRLYPKKLFENAKFWGGMTFVSIMLSCLSIIACTLIGLKLDRTMPYYFVTDSNTFLAITTGFCAFMFFKNIQIKYSPFINAVAATCFGVLQIHANSDIMRQWLWKDMLNNVGVYSKNWMPIHAIVSVLAVFVVCAVIDYLRIYLLEKPFFKWWNKCESKITNRYKKSEEK